MLPSLFGTVGTDGRAFDRLVGWLDRWLMSHGDSVEAYLETGASTPPHWLIWTQALEPGERELAVRAADIVVCDGAAASVTLCAAAGQLPIIVPRDASQTLICRGHAAAGRIRLAEHEDGFARLMSRALRDVSTRAPVG